MAADCWTFVGRTGPLGIDVVQAIGQLLGEAGVPALAIAVDNATDNVTVVEGPADKRRRQPSLQVQAVEADLPVHPHGLLHTHLFRYLLQSKARLHG